MRITGGELTGRILGTVKGWNVRPTSSKVRQAIFNITGNDISGYRVVDLFAGSGIMGIEALSRGAVQTYFFDNSSRSLALIKKNLEICRLEKKGYVIKTDLSKGIPSDNRLESGSIDLAFIDPPYGKDLIPGVLESIVKAGVMADDSYIVAESNKNDVLPEKAEDFCLVKTRHYGETKIDIYRNN